MDSYKNNNEIRPIVTALSVVAIVLSGWALLMQYLKNQDKIHTDKTETKKEITATPTIPKRSLDTAYILDAKNFYKHIDNRAVKNVNRIYMITQSGRELIQDIQERKVGYFVKPGDTVILNQNNTIINSLRHERMKDKFVKSR